MDVGFIGLGNMGAPMAVNLLKAGHSLTVCDLLPANEKPLLELGAKSVTHPSELARVSEFIFTSLPGPNEMELVSTGSNGILEGILPDSVYIDLTTNRVSLVRSIAQNFKDKDCHMLDAPAIHASMESSYQWPARQVRSTAGVPRTGDFERFFSMPFRSQSQDSFPR